MSTYDTSRKFESICLKLLSAIGRDKAYIDMSKLPDDILDMDTFIVIYSNGLNQYWLSVRNENQDNLLRVFETVFGRTTYSEEYIHNDMLNDLNKYGKEDLMVLSKLLT